MASVAVRPVGVVGTATAAHALVAALGVTAPTPTWAAVNTSFEPRQAIGSRSVSLDRLLVEHRAVNGTAIQYIDDLILADDTTRTTTEAERVVGEIRDYIILPANWDGEGAAAPVDASLADAAAFVQLLVGTGTLTPEPMLLASGRAGLFWESAGLYADLEFTGEGTITYYVERDGGKHKGISPFSGDTVPELFRVLLRS